VCLAGHGRWDRCENCCPAEERRGGFAWHGWVAEIVECSYRGDLPKPLSRSLPRFADSCQTVVGAFMNEVTRRVTEEILVRANEAIGRDEAKGPKLDQCWKRFEKLNGGIVGVKSWEQIKRIAEAALADGREPEA
jgi:hypothetical protein